MKKSLLRIMAFLCIFSLLTVSFVNAEGGYGDNSGSIKDPLEREYNVSELVETSLETKGRYVSENYCKISYSVDSISSGESCTLTATPKDDSYRFVGWKNEEGEILSTDETYTHTFNNIGTLTAAFQTDVIMDIDFDSGDYQPANLDTMQLVADGDNKYMRYHSNYPWALTKIKYRDGSDVYSNTFYEPNTTYKMALEYYVVDPGTKQYGIIGIAPHKVYYSGDSPALRISVDDEDIGKWIKKEYYFQTTDATGMGESYVADGLFQICDCIDFDIYVDNLRIEKTDTPGFEEAKNEATISDYKKVGGKTLVPLGMNAAALRMAVEKPASAKVYDKNGLVVSNESAIASGMSLVDSDSTYELSLIGDADNSGEITVTDIVKGIDAIFETPSDELTKSLIDTDENGVLTVTDIVKMRSAVLGKAESEKMNDLSSSDAKTYSVRSYIDYFTVYGRLRNEIFGIGLFQAAAGVRFSAFCEGDVYANLSCAYGNGKVYFTVYVDGQRIDKRFIGNSGTVKIAEDIEKGYHEFEFIKQNDIGSVAIFDSVTLNGTLVPSNINTNPTIEFVGDSITSGVGSLYDDKGTEAYHSNDGSVNTDATSSYAFMTSRTLGLNYSQFSAGGRTLANCDHLEASRRRECIAELYEYTNPWKSQTEYYNFGSGSDIIVVNLGTNDASAGITDDRYETAMRNFIAKLKLYNPNAKIVWCYGMMNQTSYVGTMSNVISDLGGDSAGLYLCRLPYDTGAAGSVSTEEHFYSHPVRAGHEAAAEVLVNFIKTKVLG